MLAIAEAMFDEVPLLRKLYADFVRCCQEGPSYNQELHVEIAKTCKNEINAQILQARALSILPFLTSKLQRIRNQTFLM